MNEEGNLEIIIDDGIANITFSHPKSNSLPGNLLRGMADAITKAGKNPDARVIILRSEGKNAFCAGASFDELLSIKNFAEGKSFFMGFALVINAIRKIPKFVIARVQGKAVGGGVGLAAAADYTLAHESASVKLSEYTLGIGPFVVGPIVERKVGVAAFSQMSIDTDWHDANWAKSKGLFADVFQTTDELDTAVETLARKIAAYSPEATADLKKVLWLGTEHWDGYLEQRSEISGRLVLTKYTSEYITKFKNKS